MPVAQPTAAATAAREILTRLHDLMAGRTHAQAKLNQVVQIIGEALTSEVCSIYLLRDGVLELYATRGLSQAAVHVTKLALGEGLVGTIAKHVETLNLDEAAAHPEFAYKPETGEDMYPQLRRRSDRAARARGGRALRPARGDRAAMTRSRSRRCRRWRWCWPS